MVFLHFENLERASVSLLMLYVQVPNRGLTLLEDRQMLSAKQGNYPRVTSFNALKQSTDICIHLITFSSRKYIILDKLSCFPSKHTFWEVREHLFLFEISLSTIVCVPPLFILTDTSFDAFHWLLKKTFFSLQFSVHKVFFVLYKKDQRLSAVPN